MPYLEVLEGTWEELSAHAAKFKGRKLRLIVLPTETEAARAITNETILREAAACLFSAADTLERKPGTPSIDPDEKAFGEIITEKYRKMGLKL